MKKKQFKKMMKKLDVIQARLAWIEQRMPPPKKVEFRPYKSLPTSPAEEWLINHMNYNGDDQPCPPPPKAAEDVSGKTAD